MRRAGVVILALMAVVLMVQPVAAGSMVFQKSGGPDGPAGGKWYAYTTSKARWLKAEMSIYNPTACQPDWCVLTVKWPGSGIPVLYQSNPATVRTATCYMRQPRGRHTVWIASNVEHWSVKVTKVAVSEVNSSGDPFYCDPATWPVGVTAPATVRVIV